MPKLLAWVVASLLLQSAASAACDANAVLTTHVIEWLSANPDFIPLTKQNVIRGQRDKLAYLNSLIRDYKEYFNLKSAAAIDELELCSKTELLNLFSSALRTPPK